MEINWTTFVLEIINFLILLWILKRFLYKPIKKVIFTRKEAIQKDLEISSSKLKEADDLQKKYKNRLIDWGKEKESKKLEFQHEMEEEKVRHREKLKKALEQEKIKNEALVNQKIIDIIDKEKKVVINQAMKFTSRLLAQFSTQALESKIIDLFIENLRAFSEQKISELKEEIGQDMVLVKIKTVFPLQEEEKNKLITLFGKTLNQRFEFSFKQDQTLLAGAYVELGSVIFHLNLRDELKFFAETKLNE